MIIRQARRDEAPLIAEVILMALGDSIVDGLAAPDRSRRDVHSLFEGLASMDDSQYSYLNTLAAVDDDGTPMGFMVAYDGGRLHPMRERFFEAMDRWGRDMRSMDPETVPGELYVDSLGVMQAFRGRGVASALLQAAVGQASSMGLVPGLLVEKENVRAYDLYSKLGFRKVGETPFAGTVMDHLQHSAVSDPM